MNDTAKTLEDDPENSFAKIVKEISKLQDMPEEVIEKLIVAQGSLKDSEFRDRINGTKANP